MRPHLQDRLGLGAWLLRQAGGILPDDSDPGAEAEQIQEKMKSWSRLVTGYSQIWYDPPEKLDPPVYFEPLPTDEVWRYTTSGRSWKNLAGRAGCALVRDGVVVCNTV
jgi:hypothetical protein